MARGGGGRASETMWFREIQTHHGNQKLSGMIGFTGKHKKQWFPMVSKWCEMNFVHAQYELGAQATGSQQRNVWLLAAIQLTSSLEHGGVLG